MRSLIYDCQVDLSHWNYDIIHLVQLLLELRLSADLHRSGFKAQHKRSITTAPALRS